MARPPSDIQPRLITAARRVFLEKGVDGASLRQIAKDAGTSIGMVYYYFETKDALFLAVVEDKYAGILASLEEIFAKDLPFFERVELASARFGALDDEEFEVMRIILGELIRSTPERKELLMARFRAGHLGLVLRALSDASGNEIDPRFPLPIAMLSTFGAAIFPQLLMRLAGGGLPIALPESEPLAAALVDVVQHGLLKQS